MDFESVGKELRETGKVSKHEIELANMAGRDLFALFKKYKVWECKKTEREDSYQIW